MPFARKGQEKDAPRRAIPLESRAMTATSIRRVRDAAVSVSAAATETIARMGGDVDENLPMSNSLSREKRMLQKYSECQLRPAVEQDAFIVESVRSIWGFSPRPEQAMAIRYLLFDRKDIILIAKTSFGKSLVFQAVSAIRPGSISIIILPLNRVVQGQYEKLSRVEGCRPCMLTGKTNSPEVYTEIREGCYTHILLGPELAVSKQFQDVCNDPRFRERVALVTIDEFHLVDHWSKFRQHFGYIFTLRSRLTESVPWFGCSATLDPKTLKRAMELTVFEKTTTVLRTSVDRPDISMAIFPIPNQTKSSYDALFVAIRIARNSEGRYSPQNIPKTVIFLNSRKATIDATTKLRDLLRRYCPQVAMAQTWECIRSYHANTADTDKNSIYEEFKLANSRIRIVVATDALGLGVDIPDIVNVIQYGMPQRHVLSTLLQRWGRGARGSEYSATGIWLVESWAFESPLSSDQHAVSTASTQNNLTQASQRSSIAVNIEGGNDIGDPLDDEDSTADEGQTAHHKGKNKQGPRMTNEQRRAGLAPEVRRLINATTCRRSIILEFLGDTTNREVANLCCDICNPMLKDHMVPLPSALKVVVSRAPHKNSAAGKLAASIRIWTATKAKTAKKNLLRPMGPESFLPSELSNKLAIAIARDKSVKDRAGYEAIVDEWEFRQRYSQILWSDLIRGSIEENSQASQPKVGRVALGQIDSNVCGLIESPALESRKQRKLSSIRPSIRNGKQKRRVDSIPAVEDNERLKMIRPSPNY